METVHLWKHNSTTGYWSIARTCYKNEAKMWLEVWQKDEPTALFKLAQNRPKPCGNPKRST